MQNPCSPFNLDFCKPSWKCSGLHFDLFLLDLLGPEVQNTWHRLVLRSLHPADVRSFRACLDVLPFEKASSEWPEYSLQEANLAPDCSKLALCHYESDTCDLKSSDHGLSCFFVCFNFLVFLRTDNFGQNNVRTLRHLISAGTNEGRQFDWEPWQQLDGLLLRGQAKRWLQWRASA